MHSNQTISRAFAAVVVALLSVGVARAQTVHVGLDGPSDGSVPGNGIRTTIETLYGANVDGSVTIATFGWSAAPCPGAVKIKFFRTPPALPPELPPPYTMIAERGPFDVVATKQTVALSPPVELKRGDLIGITNLSSCGVPVFVSSPIVPLPLGPGAVDTPGDATGTVTALEHLSGDVLLTASGSIPSLTLLRDRFVITLQATDPRTGATASGFPVRISDAAGFFSLPTITGDPNVPEVTVKMVDASQVRSLGFNYWFFYAPLTDLAYTLTLHDGLTGRERTYTAGPGPFCGGADTSVVQ